MNELIKAYLTFMALFGSAFIGMPMGVFLLAGTLPPIEIALFLIVGTMLLSGFGTLAYYNWDRM